MINADHGVKPTGIRSESKIPCVNLETLLNLCHNSNTSQGLWWLSLFVNMIGLKDVQIAGEILFLDVSLKVSPEETRIWICRLSKNHFHWCGWASSNHWAFEQNKKVGKVCVCSLWNIEFSPVLEHQQHSWFSSLWTHSKASAISFSSPILGPLNWDWFTPLAFLFLQFMDSRS